MILVLAAKLNFTPKFIIERSLNFGWKLPNGTWTGMLGRLAAGEVDIAASDYWKSWDRLQDFEFSFPFDMQYLTMLVKETQEDHKYLFLAPFTWDVSEHTLLTNTND